MGLFQTRRLAPCWSVAFSPSAPLLAIGSYKKVVLIDLSKPETEKPKVVPVGSDAVRSLAFAGDGIRLACATGIPGKNGAVVVLEAATGKMLQTISTFDDAVESVAFAGNLLYAAADDETVQVTDAGNGQRLGKMSEHIGRCLAVAVPSGGGADETGGAVFATGGADKAVKIWDTQVRRVVVNFDQPQGPVWGLVALPQPGRFAAACDDGRVYVFGVRRDGNKAATDVTTPRTGFVAQNLAGHGGPVYAIAAAPSGRFIVSGGADKKVFVWQNGGGKVREMAEATGDIWGVAVSGDSKMVASASMDGKVRLYELETGKLVREVLP
jgi:WD40 repeat protein